MIIIDLSNILIASLMVNQRAMKSSQYNSYYSDSSIEGISEDLLRHMILNTLRSINTKFKTEYGEIIICCDSKSWRYDYFPQYKAKRKITRKNDSIDWDEVMKLFNIIIDEIDQYFPYPVLKVENSEADDIIYVLSEISNVKKENSLIVSNDKDFIQCISEYVSLYRKSKDTIYKLQKEYLSDYI